MMPSEALHRMVFRANRIGLRTLEPILLRQFLQLNNNPISQQFAKQGVWG
jgi:hypothetical protein